MATVGQVGELVTTKLRERFDRLIAAVEDHDSDMAEVARVADEVGEMAHTIGGIYREVEQILLPMLQGKSGSDAENNDARAMPRSQTEPRDEQRRQDEGNSGADELTKDELLERAREANVQGRSMMSKEELAQAVEAEESLTKEDLLERARQADIPGRSAMTKEELRTALHDSSA